MSYRIEPKADLTVWIRAGGDAEKKKISPYVRNVLQILPSNLTTEVLICTNENDVIQRKLEKLSSQCGKVRIVFSNLSSPSSALRTLAQHTNPESIVLTLSVGINISTIQIQTGLKRLKSHVKVHGWQIKNHGNDGSCPGKGWYTSAALIHKKIVEQMRSNVPDWLDNEKLEKIGGANINFRNVEIPIMVRALQEDPNTQFFLDTYNPVSSNLQPNIEIRTQISKEACGNLYMRELHKALKIRLDNRIWSKRIWSSLKTSTPYVLAAERCQDLKSELVTELGRLNFDEIKALFEQRGAEFIAYYLTGNLEIDFNNIRKSILENVLEEMRYDLPFKSLMFVLNYLCDHSARCKKENMNPLHILAISCYGSPKVKETLKRTAYEHPELLNGQMISSLGFQTPIEIVIGCTYDEKLMHFLIDTYQNYKGRIPLDEKKNLLQKTKMLADRDYSPNSAVIGRRLIERINQIPEIEKT